MLATARQHSAGVVFLGDFWHARGALPVAVLNAVLDNLAKWDVPTLLLPGNHDQVVHGGEEHALTPLVAAKQGLFHVFTHPTVWRAALWLPYRRDADVLRACLDSHAGSLGAVFAHVDVAGAQMNERHQATYGLDAHLFPPSIPTYTGHYHLPHVVPGSNITYIGSPYQVSASEAGQRKRMLLLSPSWQLEQSLPLDVGPRHFRVEGQGARLPAGLRKGDRIRWVLPSSGQEPRQGKLTAASAAPPQVGELRSRGVDVTLIRETAPNQMAPRIANADTKTPGELLEAYALAARVPPAVTAAAAQLLAAMSGGIDADRASGLATSSSGGVPALSRGHVAFEPTKLVIQGYGPFKSKVEYPLASRGFVVVSGKVVADATGDAATAALAGGSTGDSNGAGKTSLVMAALWALQGSAASSRKAEHFVNDNAAAASVRLEALLNGQPFWVERQADRKGRLKSFSYGLGEADYTGQDARLTAGSLNELVDVELLRMMCFHGQHDMERLLTSNDGDFKRALDRLVDLSVWQHAEEAAKERAKAADTMAKQLAGSQAQLSAALSASAAAVHDTERKRDAWEEAHARDSAAASQAAEQEAQALSAAQGELHRALDALRRTWERASPARSAAQQAEAEAMQAAAAASEQVFDNSTSRLAFAPALSQAEDAVRRSLDVRNAASLAVSEAQQRASQADAAWGTAQRAAANFRGVVPTRGAEAHDHALGTCDRCLQPIDARHFSEQAAALDAQAEEASVAAGVAREGLQAANQALRAAEAAVSRTEEELRAMKADADAAANEARRQALEAMSAANRASTAARDQRAALDERFSLAQRAGTAANRALVDVCGGVEGRAPDAPAASNDGDMSPLGADRALPILDAAIRDVDAAEQRLRTAGASAAAAETALNIASSGVNPHDEVLRMLAQQQEQQQEQLDVRTQDLQAAQEEAALYDRVRTAFGDKGIQSYLLEGVAMELEAKAAEHLHALTGGALRLSLRSEPSAAVADPAHGDEAAAGPKRRGKKAAGEQPVGAVPQDVVKDKMRLRILTPLTLDSSDDGDSASASQFGEVERALEQLSGGERRRCALALAIAYAELAAHRGGLRSELLVLDEALQHLDPQGVERVCALLRSLDFKTVLLTSQAGSRAVALADSVDLVVKVAGRSEVQVADGAPLPPRLYETDEEVEDDAVEPKDAQQTSFVASNNAWGG